MYFVYFHARITNIYDVHHRDLQFVTLDLETCIEKINAKCPEIKTKNDLIVNYQGRKHYERGNVTINGYLQPINIVIYEVADDKLVF